MFVKVLLAVSLAVLLVAADVCVQPECPKFDGTVTDLVLLPNVYNCSLYIACSNGVGIDR